MGCLKTEDALSVFELNISTSMDQKSQLPILPHWQPLDGIVNE